MNFFCRIFGHTWVMKSQDPKIRWTTEPKMLSELILTAEGEPVFFWECARCQEKRVLDSSEYRKVKPGEGRVEPSPSRAG